MAPPLRFFPFRALQFWIRIPISNLDPLLLILLLLSTILPLIICSLMAVSCLTLFRHSRLVFTLLILLLVRPAERAVSGVRTHSCRREVIALIVGAVAVAAAVLARGRVRAIIVIIIIIWRLDPRDSLRIRRNRRNRLFPLKCTDRVRDGSSSHRCLYRRR